MTIETKTAYEAVLAKLQESSAKFPSDDYYDLLKELQGHLQCLVDCWDDEHREGGE